MRFWLFDGVPPRTAAHYELDNGGILNMTQAYIELFSPYRNHFTGPAISDPTYDNTYIVNYWVQLSEYQWFVATCWQDAFDWINHLATYPTTSLGVTKALRESWPTVATLLARAEDPARYDTSFVRMRDPDTNAETWMLACFFGNVQINDLDDLQEGYAGEALERLLPLTIKVLLEWGEGWQNIPHIFEHIGSELEKEEMRRMIRSGGKLLKDHLGTIVSILAKS